MRLYSLILFVVISLCNNYEVFAEKEYVFDLEVTTINKGKNACKALKVIDLRKNKENIGYVVKGAFNKKLTVITPKPVDAFLASAYAGMKNEGEADNDELVFVLYNMEIQDRLEEDESGTFHINGDFFRGSGDRFTFLASIDSLYEMRSGTDVTNMLLTGSKTKLFALLSYYSSDTLSADGKVYSFTALTDKRKNDKLPFAIYNNSTFRKGIYYTKDQFLNNSPVDIPFVRKTYTREGGLKMHYFHYADEKGKKGERIKENTFFAIYDGENWWVTNGNYCTIMKFVDNDFFALQFFRHGYTGNSSAGVASGAMLFGLAGALIGAGVDAMSTGRGKQSPWGLYRGRFDALTKEFIPVDRPNMPQ